MATIMPGRAQRDSAGRPRNRTWAGGSLWGWNGSDWQPKYEGQKSSVAEGVEMILRGALWQRRGHVCGEGKEVTRYGLFSLLSLVTVSLCA